MIKIYTNIHKHPHVTCALKQGAHINKLVKSLRSNEIMSPSLLMFSSIAECNYRLLTDWPASDIQQNQWTHQWFRRGPLAGCMCTHQRIVLTWMGDLRNEASQWHTVFFVCVRERETDNIYSTCQHFNSCQALNKGCLPAEQSKGLVD